MDLLESVIQLFSTSTFQQQLTDSDRQKLSETLQLKNNSSNVASKQKTLDSWIVKRDVPLSSSSKEEVTNSKETALIAEAAKSSRDNDSADVSTILQNSQLPSTSVTPLTKPSVPENEMHSNEKQLRVLLNRQDCLDSKQKFLENSKYSSEKKLINPTEKKSPSKKIFSPEKHSPTPARSYNLRSARGISDEKSSTEAINSNHSISEHGETDRIYKIVHKSVTKPKSKVSLEKDKSSNSCASVEEGNYNQKTDPFKEIISEENSNISECKTSTTVIQSKLEETAKVLSVDASKMTVTGANSTLVELETTQVVKGKRTVKNKESKMLRVSNTTQKSASIQENGTTMEINVNIKNNQSVPIKKCSKIIFSNADSIESSIERTVQSDEIVPYRSPSEKQVSTNDIIKPVSKLRVRKTTKSKDKNDLVIHEKTPLDTNSLESSIEKVHANETVLDSSPSEKQVSTNDIVKPVSIKVRKTTKSKNKNDLVLHEKTPLETNSLESSIEKTAQSNETVLDSSASEKQVSTNDIIKPVSIKVRKTTKSKDKSDLVLHEKTPLDTNSLESSIEKTVQSNETIDSSRSEKQDSTNDIVKPVSKLKVRKTTKTKDKYDVVLQEKTPLDTGVKIKIKMKNIPVQEIDTDIRKDINFEMEVSDKQLESAKNSKSQSNEHVRETEDILINDTDIKTSVNLDSKRTYRKAGNKNKRLGASKISLLLNSELASKNNLEITTPIETSSKLSLSQKELSKETEEALIKDSKSMNSKRITRKKGNENKILAETKKNLLLDPDLTIKKNDKDSMISTEISAIESPKNSAAGSKKWSKETKEFLVEDTNRETLVNSDTKKRCRKRGSESKRTVITKKSLIIESEQNSTNNHNNSIISNEISSKLSPSNITKKSSIQETSLIDNSSATEKVTLALNQNKSSQHVNTDGGDTSHNELNSLQEMKEPSEDQSEKSSIISPKVPKSNDNVLHSEKYSKLSSVNEEVKTSKRKTSATSPTNTKKKLKVKIDEKQSNVSESISDNLNTKKKNSRLNLKKSVLKRKATSSKQKAITGFNEDKLDILITNSEAKSSDSNIFQGTEDQPLKELKSNNTLIQDDSETTRPKNSKRIMKKTSKKKTNALNIGAVSDINLLKNDEMEKLNRELVEESSLEKKPLKPFIEKTSTKSINRGKSVRKKVLDSSSDQLSNCSKEHEHLSKESPEMQMELDISHFPTEESSEVHMELDSSNVDLEKSSEIQMELDSTAKKSNTCDSCCNSEDIIGKAEETIPVTPVDVLLVDTSESKKEKCVQSMEISIEKTDLIINNSNNTDISVTNFKSSVEFDKRMQHNYEAYCKVKEMLEIIGMSIEELFENQEMIDSLKSEHRDGVYVISKCKTDSKISIYFHSSKKDLKNTINKLKKEYTDENK